MQIQILLMAQVGDREAADRVDVVDVATGRDRVAIGGGDGFLCNEIRGDVGNVVARACTDDASVAICTPASL